MGRTTQAMQHLSPSTFLGSGKVEELRRPCRCSASRASCSMKSYRSQGRNLQDALGGKVQVLDRTMLILQIFSQRGGRARPSCRCRRRRCGTCCRGFRPS